MVALTVTGGANHPPVQLTFGPSSNTIAAESLAYMMSQQFGSAPATLTSQTPDLSALNVGSGYLIADTSIGSSGNPVKVSGFQAITFKAAATVVGGTSADNPNVVAGNAGLNYVTSGDGATIALGGGSNVIGLMGSGNTVYGGSGHDTIGISAADTVFAGTGSTLIDLGASTVMGTTPAGSDIIGSQSPTSTLSVGGGNFAVTVSGGFGTLNASDAAGLYVGGAAGSNTIIGSSIAPVTIYGGGTNDLLESSSANSVIYGVGDGTLIDVYASNDTIYGGYGTSTINIGAGLTDSIVGGYGSTTINLGAGSSVDVTGNSGALTFNDDAPGSGNSTIVGGTGTIDAHGYFTSAVGGSGGANIIVNNGSQFALLQGGSTGDYIQAGSGNTTLIAGPGSETLAAGSGADTMIGNADPSASTFFKFFDTSTAPNYTIDNFGTSPSNTIYVTSQADVNYILASQAVSGGSTVAHLNANTTITLANTTVTLTSNDVKVSP